LFSNAIFHINQSETHIIDLYIAFYGKIFHNTFASFNMNYIIYGNVQIFKIMFFKKKKKNFPKKILKMLPKKCGIHS